VADIYARRNKSKPVRPYCQNRGPAFRAHRKPQEAVIYDEFWYGDKGPNLGSAFTSQKAKTRHRSVIDQLLKAARTAEKHTSEGEDPGFQQLADKMATCRPRARCGSVGCPLCGRAFQRANVAAQEQALSELVKASPKKSVVLVTIIPPRQTFMPDELSKIDIAKAKRQLMERLAKAGIKRRMIGSCDISWENRSGRRYFQLHWHIAMHTGKPEELKEKLQAIFPRSRKHERNVDISEASDLNFLGYMNKVNKLPALLRNCRRSLPELLLVLDRYDPLDFMVISGFSIRAENSGFSLTRRSKSG
jgi:hypothetical protein